VLAAGESQTIRPDWVLSVRGRFGVWRVEAADPLLVLRSWHMPTLVASGASALLVALLGVFLAVRLGSAQRLAEQRVSFVNHVSHELRTPLMNMLLNADLTADLLEEQPDEARRRLGLLREEGQRLARLTENVLTWSRGERGKLQFEPRPCDVEAVLGDVARIFEPLLARRAIAFHRYGAPVAGPRVLDPDALTQIVANLFSNVEKYAGREATLDFTVVADAESLTVTVADDGPGIPRGAEQRVFAPFERLDDSVNTGAAGAGLGLAIARDLATRLGGTLQLVRRERGACFELRIPAPVAANLPC
jgi:signal transduction histidine kinase